MITRFFFQYFNGVRYSGVYHSQTHVGKVGLGIVRSEFESFFFSFFSLILRILLRILHLLLCILLLLFQLLFFQLQPLSFQRQPFSLQFQLLFLNTFWLDVNFIHIVKLLTVELVVVVRCHNSLYI